MEIMNFLKNYKRLIFIFIIIVFFGFITWFDIRLSELFPS